jgi:hypothetical protein
MEEPLDRLLVPLAALMQWFSASRLRAAVIGGVAASIRGKPRLTKDIDAVILGEEPETLLETAAPFGLTPRIPDVLEFARKTRVLLLRYSPANIDVDLSLGTLPFEEEVVERSTVIDLRGIPVRVASAEDVVIMKAVAGRARDVADIENLLETNPDLDVERVRRWVREFSSVLDMPEIHENLEKLLKGRRR